MAAHFEIHVNDMARAKAFYAGLFAWTFEPMAGAEAVEYQLLGGVHFQHGLTGGMMKRVGPAPQPHAPIRGGTMTFDVADCDERYAWALSHGGSEALPPADYLGVGRCAYVEDGEGNVVGFVSPERGAPDVT